MSPLTKDQAKALFARFKDLKLLVIGDLMVDEYVWGRVNRISPEAPIPVVEVSKEEFKPGGAANVGRNIVTLGAKVSIAGLIGKDAAGEKLLQSMAESGANVQAVLADTDRPTTIKTRVIAQHQQVVRVDRESSAPISSSVRASLCASLEEHISRADGIIFSDYNKGLLGAELVSWVMERAQGKVVMVDPKPSNITLFKGASLIKTNKKEAEAAAGFLIRSDADAEKAASNLRELLRSEALLITRGEEGMTLMADGRFFHVPTQARQVFDVTGAGDTVISVAALARCAGASMAEAASLANVAAGISVAHLGVYAVTQEEIIEQL